jgi:glycine cleavage system aminomethyltransferase T
MGWERVNYFAREDQPTSMTYSFFKPDWLQNVVEEHRACRDTAALFDQTSFSKFLVQGRDAEQALQRICSNNVAGPPGSVVYTAMLNERGCFESVCL